PLDRLVAAPATDLVIPLQPDPTATFFGMNAIHIFSFTLTGEDSLSMERDALDEEFTPAQLSIDGTAFGEVGLRYKGSNYYSMPRCFDEEGTRSAYVDCRNVSLKVKFNKYVDSLRLRGMKRLNLHSMSYDNSKLREMLAYELFREMGLYTCRTVFVKVLVNGVSRGIFAGVEEIDGRFTKSRWHETGDGNLYKEVWPLYNSKSKYRLALKTNDNPEDSADVSRMVDFHLAIESSTPENFRATISPFMDLDYWLRFIIVDRAIHNGDGVMTWYVDGSWLQNHNYYFYEDEAPGTKFWLIPWDMNATFTKNDPIFDDYDMPEWNEVPDSCEPMEIWGGSLAVPPNCDKLTSLTAAVCWNRFVSMGEQFLGGLFTPERMQQRVDAWAAVLEPEMDHDPYVDRNTWESSVEWLRGTMVSLSRGFDDYIHKRESSMDSSGYAIPFPVDSGFTPGLLNNFEFGADAAIDSWAYALVSENSSIELFHDTAGPIGGGADLRCNFSLRPADTTKEYSEWVMIELEFNRERDCSGLTGLRIDLLSDITRQVSIGLLSDAYARHGVGDGAWYGWVVSAGPKARQYTCAISDIDYPEWVTHDRPALLDSVLAGLTGIWISPGPHYGGDGELQTVPDSGYLKIDNILFLKEPE
ncbi:MAG: CotH kinase family protein, partial [Chitinispirillaceae bacterium]|nr:CotH kinase family protein [Chitinispirillaceae bacterium]